MPTVDLRGVWLGSNEPAVDLGEPVAAAASDEARRAAEGGDALDPARLIE